MGATVSTAEDDRGVGWTDQIETSSQATENVMRRMGFGRRMARQLRHDHGEAFSWTQQRRMDASRPTPVTVVRRIADLFRSDGGLNPFDFDAVDIHVGPLSQPIPEIVASCARQFRTQMERILAAHRPHHPGEGGDGTHPEKRTRSVRYAPHPSIPGACRTAVDGSRRDPGSPTSG